MHQPSENTTVLWCITVLCGLVLSNDEIVAYAPVPFLPQTLLAAGWSTLQISFVLSSIWWCSIVTIIAHTLWQHQQTAAAAAAAAAGTAPAAADTSKPFARRKEMFIAFALLLQVVSSGACAYDASYWVLLASRGVQGIASALCWVFCLSLVCDLFPADRNGDASAEQSPTRSDDHSGGGTLSSRNGTALSIVLSINSLGDLAGPPLGGWLADTYGVQAAYWWVSIISAALFTLFVVCAIILPRPDAVHLYATIGDGASASNADAANRNGGTAAATAGGTASAIFGSGSSTGGAPASNGQPSPAFNPIRPTVGTGPAGALASPYLLAPATSTAAFLTSSTAAAIGSHAHTTAATIQPLAVITPPVASATTSGASTDAATESKSSAAATSVSIGHAHSGGDDADDHPDIDPSDIVDDTVAAPATVAVVPAVRSVRSTPAAGPLPAVSPASPLTVATVGAAPGASDPSMDIGRLPSPGPLTPAADAAAASAASEFVSPIHDPVILSMSVMVALVGVVRTALDMIIPLYMSTVLNADPFTIGLIFGVESLVFVVANSLIGARIDTLHTRHSVALWSTILAVLCFLLFWWPAPDMVGFRGYALWGAVMVVMGTCMAFTTLAPSYAISERAKQVPGLNTEACMGVFNLFWFGGYGVGSVVAGIPSDPTNAHSLHIFFIIIGVALLLFVPTFLRLTYRRLSTAHGLTLTGYTCGGRYGGVCCGSDDRTGYDIID